MKKKGHFAVITHTYTPHKDDPKNYDVFERCEFVDRINDRMINTATVIIDFETNDFVKNRVNTSTVDMFVSHIEKTYPAEWKEFLKVLEQNGIKNATTK